MTKPNAMALEVRPSTGQDFTDFVRQTPPFRVKAWTALEDGVVIAIGGVAFQNDGVFQAFFDVKDDETRRRYPVSLYKNALRVIKDVCAMGISRIVAVPREGMVEAEPFLRRLGFLPLGDGSRTFFLDKGVGKW